MKYSSSLGAGFGLSRLWGRVAGALANLVAAKLIDDGETVFAYTFASPGTVESTNGAPHAAKYDSIFNIVNEDDFIPYFPLKQWYFTRYGRTTQNVSVSGTNESGWSNQLGIDTYMHMDSPIAPMNLLAEVAPGRNNCYYYNNNVSTGCARVLSETTHPSNTEGYYIRVEVLIGEYDEYHSPMFLMQYLAAAAAGEPEDEVIKTEDFVWLDLAPYLEPARLMFLSQLTDIDGDDTSLLLFWDAISAAGDNSTIRMFHPHMPESYVYLTSVISSTSFSTN